MEEKSVVKAMEMDEVLAMLRSGRSDTGRGMHLPVQGERVGTSCLELDWNIVAAAGIKRAWKTKFNRKSPQYTTRWEELRER